VGGGGGAEQRRGERGERADAREVPAYRIKVEMPVEMYVACCRERTLLEAGMSKPVDDHVVVRAHQRLHDTKAGAPARRIEHDVAHAEEIRNLSFERQ
jgi:hypothetical protein